MVPGLSSWEEGGVVSQHEKLRKRKRCGAWVTAFEVVVPLGPLRCAVQGGPPVAWLESSRPRDRGRSPSSQRNRREGRGGTPQGEGEAKRQLILELRKHAHYTVNRCTTDGRRQTEDRAIFPRSRFYYSANTISNNN